MAPSLVTSWDISTQHTKELYITRAKNEKVSGWLMVLPMAKSHFDLPAQEFWDALAIPYRRPLREIPDLCDGCSSPFSLSHALSCRKGGLVIPCG